MISHQVMPDQVHPLTNRYKNAMTSISRTLLKRSALFFKESRVANYLWRRSIQGALDKS